MDENERLAYRFEEHRARLRAVAYRMLGSLVEADDAVQDAWLRLARTSAGEIENLGAWLTRVVARVCLNMLRARGIRREEPMGVRLPDPIVRPDDEHSPEERALLTDSVSYALLIVLDSLSPAERIAFVLHDMFEVPFEEIAPMVDRTPVAARQLASRARRRVKGRQIPDVDTDRARQRVVVDAFFRAARGGDLDGLAAVLDPDVVLRSDRGAQHGPAAEIRSATAVARQSRGIPGSLVRLVLVNGAVGAVITVDGRPFAVMGFTIVANRILEIHAIADPGRVRRVAASVLVDDLGRLRSA